MAVALILSAVACNEEELFVDKNDTTTEETEEPSVTPGTDFDIFASLPYDEMVYVEGGTFLMGAQPSSSSQPNYDSSRGSDESPVHAVTLSSYYIGKYEVTQALWEYVMMYSGSAADGSTMTAVEGGPWLGYIKPSSPYGLGDNYPAYWVSYNDIVNYFLPRLNQITGKNYRLPTEAEWEYAARGGQQEEYTRTQGTSGIYYKYAGSYTIDDVAWYSSNSNSTTHSVGGKAPNALGLYDMSGNVQEWCRDIYDDYSSASVTDPSGPTTGPACVNRGGGWNSEPHYCRVSNRGNGMSSNRSNVLGFRLVLGVELPEPEPEVSIEDPVYDQMVYVEGGTFRMGARYTDFPLENYDSEAYLNESPVHKVTLSSFYIGKYEVTQRLWEYIMNYSGKVADGSTMSAVGSDPWLGTNPSSTYGVGDNYPAYYVSYSDIVDYFLPRLNQITGKSYRLPTEAEWEYAARGGQKDEYTCTQGVSGTYYKYSGSNAIEDVAWYSSNSNSTSHPVGTKQANALGLYDMSGNVWEWCSDWYGSYSSTSVTNPTGPTTGSYRVSRGGCWNDGAVYCRVSIRDGSTPSSRGSNLGFRLALSL